MCNHYRVFLVGASGNLGSRLIPALIAHGHTVVAYVRSSSKLTSLLPPSLLNKIEVVSGDAEDEEAMKAALVKFDCDAVICCAGFISMPFQKRTRLGEISSAVARAAVDVGNERGKPLRGWWLGGMIVMEIAGTGYTGHD
jgi:nucleoside-diphosphate-sugar epimerase